MNNLYKKIALLLFLVTPVAVFSQLIDSVVTADTVLFQNFQKATLTYKIPAHCVTTITVQVWGGSGAGKGVTSGTNGGGGGGGGGAYSSSVLNVTPGATYTLAVGAPGAGSTANGGPGGDSWFSMNGIKPTSNATGILAKGGVGATANGGAGGAAGAGFGTVKSSGGAGGNYSGNGGGGGGAAGGSVNASTGAAGANGNGSNGGAGGAPSAGGNGGGGAGGNNNGLGTDNSFCFGCGGGGGVGTNGGAGGNGSPGLVKIILPHPLDVSVSNSQIICPGATPLTFTATAIGEYGGPYTYQWQSSVTDSVNGYSNATGTSTNNTYSAGSISTTTWFRCIANAGNCLPDTSNFITVTVTNLTATIDFPQTICSGSTPSMLTSAIIPATVPATYQWQQSTTNATSGFSNAAGVATNSTYNPSTVSVPTWYDLIVSAPGCSTYTTSAISITPSTVPSTCNAGTTKTIYSVNTLSLTGTGVGGSVTTGAWSVSSSSPAGTHVLSTTAQTNDPASVTFTPQTGFTGTVVLTLTTNTNGCAPVSVCTKTINVLPAAITTLTYSNAATWTVPGCVNTITVQVWGAGGGGGSGGGTLVPDGSGGGGGAYSASVLSVTQGTTYSISVGVGGSGAPHTGSGAKGGNGQTSWFGTPTTVSAQGGIGGLGSGQPGYGSPSPGGRATAGYGNKSKRDGGNGASGCLWPGGGGGGSGCPLANGNNAPDPGTAGTVSGGCGGASNTATPGATACAGGGAGGNGGQSQGPSINGNCSTLLATPGGFPGGGGGGGTNACDQPGQPGAKGQVIISYGPAFPVILFSNSATICQGQSTDLIASTDFSAQFIWSTGSTSASVSADTITVAPTTTTTYTISDVSGCATAITVTVTVNPAFTLNVTSTSTCQGQSATLTASGASSYVWSTGAATNTITASPSVTTTYTVSGTSGGCSVKQTGTITVRPNAVIALSSGAGSDAQSVCINTTLSPITYSISGGGTGAGATGLPTGVSSSYAGNVFTITGTPTAPAGTYGYTVTTTGTCTQTKATGSIVITPNAAITLSSAAGTTTQTLCINTPLTNITYTVSGGGTGATVTGLPAGLTSSYSSGIVTISGNPTAVGTFNYTITTTGTCAQTSTTGTITGNPNTVIALTSVVGSDAQNLCLTNAITTITYSLSGGATGATVTGLPGGVNYTYNGGNGVVTISGTPTAVGTSTYTLTSSGGCAPVTVNGTITINSNAAIALTSAGATTSQTLCLTDALTAITYTVSGGGTGATVTGLPTGVIGSYSGGVVTISGIPSVVGTYNYTVTTTGSCSQTSAAGSITINPNAAIVLTSAATTTSQTLCLTNSLATITYTVSGGGTGATVTGLPTGVSSTYSGGTVTISGTPNVLGTYNYTVTTTGTCSQTAVTGSITINPNAAIALTSGAGTDAQSVCVNTPLTTITYTVSGGATSAAVTGLPSGISGGYSGGVVTLSGSPTAVSTQTLVSTYTVTTIGGCAQLSVTGTITVYPDATITLSSGLGSNAPSVCVNTAINPIRYTIGGGATSATVTPLPLGLTGSITGNVFTISGTPTTVSTQTIVSTYTVGTVGTCTQTALTGTITVYPDATIALTPGSGSNAQAVCINTAITPITYTLSGGATSATVTPLPSGLTGVYSSGIFTISGTPTTISTTTMTTAYTVGTVGTCIQTALTGTITVYPDATITLSSGLGSNAPSVCVNTAITPITYTLSGGASSATVTALPSGLTGSMTSANLFTISGTPTTVSTQTIVSTYTVGTVGTCTQTALTGTITVYPDAIIALTPASGSNAQAVCVNTAISPITYTLSGGATSATVTPLPSGLTGVYSSGIFTISGTPTTINTTTITVIYTVGTTGTCVQSSLTGTITIYPDATIALSSGPGSNAPSVCVNTAINPIRYTIGGGATSATVTPLPSGLTGSISGNVFTISGTPTTVTTQTVVSTYTVGTTGSCVQTFLTGTITVYPDATIALTSAGTTTAQTVCVRGTPIVPITYTLSGGAYNATVTGLPNGVTGSYNAGIFTISGTPTVVSTVTVVSTYTVHTSGSACVQQQMTGTIQMDPLPTAYAGSAPPICETDSITISDAVATDGSITWSTSNGQGVLTNTLSSTPQYKASPSDQGKNVLLTMTVTSTNNCNVLPETASSTVNIPVRPTLTAVSTVTTSVCQNNPATVTFNVTSAGTSPYTFTYTQRVNNGVGTTATVTTPTGSKTATISAPTGTAGKVVYSLTQVQDANCTKILPGTTQTVIVNKLPTATITQDEDICRDSTAKQLMITGTNGARPYLFTYNINNGGSGTIQGDTTALISPSTDRTGTFVYTLTNVKDANGCEQTLSKKVTITVYENPHAIFSVSPQHTSILEPEITVTDASTATTSWLWNFGDGNVSPSSNPEPHTYGDTGTYRIKLLVSNALCKDSTYEYVKIILPTMLYIPSTFTPNDDGVNDVFKAEGDGIIKFEMLVYDRWGNLVFHSNDINKGWDGKANGGSEASMIDTYVYVVKIRALANKHDYVYRGTLNLIK